MMLTTMAGGAARVSAGPGGCRYGVVPGHYDRFGRWHPAHCR
jgi:hypothetical protein